MLAQSSKSLRDIVPMVSNAMARPVSSTGFKTLVRASMSAEAAREVSDLVNFDGCSDICRAVPLGRVLERGAAILSNSQGSSQSYAQSRPVEEIFAFISHNWTTPRSWKFWCLTLHFQFNRAVVIAVAFLLVGGVLTARGSMPTIPEKVHGNQVGFCCRLFFLPTFFVALALLQVHGMFWSSGPLVFIDKLCINQTDPDTMAMGIRKLGAFIGVSKRMVAIYTEVYTAKLWTVYEVAAFLALHPVEDLDLVPALNSMLFLTSMSLAYVFYLCIMVTRIFVISGFQGALLSYGIAPLIIFAYIRATRRWKLARKEALQRLSLFDVRACSCAVEADRPLVYRNIALLMRAKGYVTEGVSQDTALDVFNQVIRRTLPGAFAARFGTSSFALKHNVFIGMIMNLASAMDYLTFMEVSGWRGHIGFLLNDLTWAFVLWPLLLSLADFLASLRSDLRGVKSVLLCMVLAASHLTVAFSFNMIGRLVDDLGRTSDLGLAALLVVCPLTWAAPWLIAAGRRRRRLAGVHAEDSSQMLAAATAEASEGVRTPSMPCCTEESVKGQPAVEEEAAPGAEQPEAACTCPSEDTVYDV